MQANLLGFGKRNTWLLWSATTAVTTPLFILVRIRTCGTVRAAHATLPQYGIHGSAAIGRQGRCDALHPDRWDQRHSDGRQVPRRRHLPGPARGVPAAFIVFSTVNSLLSMVCLYGRAGRLTATNGGFRPAQWPTSSTTGSSSPASERRPPTRCSSPSSRRSAAARLRRVGHCVFGPKGHLRQVASLPASVLPIALLDSLFDHKGPVAGVIQEQVGANAARRVATSAVLSVLNDNLLSVSRPMVGSRPTCTWCAA